MSNTPNDNSSNTPAGYYTDPLQPAAMVPVPAPAAKLPPPEPPKPRKDLIAPATKEAETQQDASLASIIDTIEAIIIALIIALTFRAFVVEAFVIPTGSMAPTLLGAHFKVVCKQCGYEFDRDASLENQVIKEGNTYVMQHIEHGELISNRGVPVGGVPVGESPPIYCPNCGYPLLPNDLPQYLETPTVLTNPVNNTTAKVPLAWANNGDRILVLKYLYAVMQPARWDVIVFKEPQGAKDNYIKRLIGLPGETVEIIRGDIYVGGPGDYGLRTRLCAEISALQKKIDSVAPAFADPVDVANRDRKLAQLNPLLMIQRKPDHVQSGVWQLVYDNDYYPKDEDNARPTRDIGGHVYRSPPWHNPWTPAGPGADSWVRPFGPVLIYNGPKAGGLAFNCGEHYSMNLLGYNNDWNERSTLMPVGDLHLETLWRPTSEEAAQSVALTLGQTDNCFRVTWTPQGVVLAKLNEGNGQFVSVEAQKLAEAPAARPGEAHRLEFDNVDHAVSFYIDGVKVLYHESPWSAFDAHTQAEADRTRRAAAVNEDDFVKAELQRTRIGIELGGPSTLAHLKLMRDLYYTQSPMGQNLPTTANEGNPLTLHKAGDPGGFEDEYFPLGDNSRRSLDGRMWSQVYPALDDLGIRIGVVPRRYLLGKAFFVYWPAGFRATDNDAVPIFSNLPIVPDVGDMRFIH